jgi:hypothetical protein
MSQKPDEQPDKFKALAKETQCDESERAFDEALRKIAKQKPKDEKPAG